MTTEIFAVVAIASTSFSVVTATGFSTVGAATNPSLAVGAAAGRSTERM